MVLIQKTQIKVEHLSKITLEYGDQPVKLTLNFKDGTKEIFSADEQAAKVSLMLDAKVLQEKFGL